jgi:hypothetical protein
LETLGCGPISSTGKGETSWIPSAAGWAMLSDKGGAGIGCEGKTAAGKYLA